jgi:PAS domain S-box-containing protein
LRKPPKRKPARPARTTAESAARRQAAEGLLDIAQALGSTLDLKETLKTITRRTALMLGAERATINLLEHGRLRPVMSQFADGHVDATLWAAFKARGPYALDEAPAHAEAIRQRRAVAVDDVTAGRYLPRQWLETARVRALLVAPLVHREQVIGTLTVDRTSGSHAWTRAQIGLAATIANQAAMAIANARHFQRAEERTERLTALSGLTRLMTSATDSESVFRGIAEAATALLKAKMAWVFIYDPHSETLREGGSFGMKPEHASLMRDFLPLPSGGSLAGAVLESGQAEYIEDIHQDPRWLNKRLAVAADLHVCAAIPLIHHGQALGVLVAVFGRRDEFTPDEKELVGLLADQAAIAMENARLLEDADRRRREAELVAEVARSIGASLDLDTVLERLVEGARELTESEMARIALRDGAAERFTIRYWVGYRHPGWAGVAIEPGHGLGGKVLLTGQSVRTSNYAEDPNIPKDYVALVRDEGVIAAMAVPVRGDERIEALLVVLRRSARAFTDRDEAVLLRLAGHAAVAIQNARLFAESAARQRQAEALAQLGRALSETLDPSVVGQRTVGSLRALLHTQGAALFSLDAARALRTIAGAGNMEAIDGLVLPEGTGVIGLAVREGRPVATPDLLADDRIVLPPAQRASIERAAYRSVLAVPLTIKDRVIGALSVGDAPGRVFDQEEVQLMQAFAAEAALALENARLHGEAERGRREAEVLAELARTINSSLDLDAVFAEIVAGAREICRGDLAFAALHDPSAGAVVFRQWLGTRWAGYGSLRMEPGKGSAGLVLATGRPFRTDCYLEDPRISKEYAGIARDEGIVAQVVVPIMIEARTEGFLAVNRRSAEPFADHDEAILVQLADHAAVAIRNARLFAESAARRREAELLGEIARAITASLDLDTVLQRITDSAKDLVGSDMAMIGVRERDEETIAIRYRVGSRYPSGRTLSIEPGKGLGGQVLLTGRPCRTDDYAADPAFGKEYVGAFRKDGVVTAMGVPIKAEERVVGVLYVANRSARPFTDHDETLVLRLADEAAIAIKNAQLFAREAESERRYRSLFENANDPVATFALDGTITSVNPEVTRLLGYSREELVGRHAGEFAHPATIAMMAERARRALGGGQVPPAVEVVAIRKDRSEVIAEGRMSVVRDASGAVTGLQVIYRDMTERKRAEAALRASEERYRTLVEGSIQGVCILRDWVTLFANTALARMLGYESPRELIGLDARCWIAPHDLSRVESLAAARRRGEPAPSHFEFQALRKDGALIWAEVEVSEIVWDGEPARQITGFDVTERKRAEQAARESSEFNRQIIASAREGVIVYDRQLRYVVWNPFVEEMTGVRAEDVAGKFCLDVFPFLREQGIHDLLQRALAGETVSSPDFQYTVAASGKAGWAAGRYGPLLDAAGRIIGVIGTLRDITERKRTEETLRQQEEQLRQSQKMEAVGRLAGGIAHDFNNLLTVITGRGDLLLRRLPAEDPVRRDLELIKKTAERAAVLTRQLLAFSRKQMLQPKVLDLNAIVAGVAQMLQRLIGEHIDLVQMLAPDLGLVKADPAQIEQIIVNLVVNARDAMPEGGRLTLETANVELDPAFVAANPGSSTGRYTVLAVSDTGEGMTPEVLAHIFEPFFTTKEVGKGTGLGLATVYGIVKQHDGYITAESAPGAGTTLRVYLRRVEERVEAAEPGLTPAGLAAAETVLLVEDEHDLRLLATEILDGAGYAVLVAAGPSEALERARGHPGPIHLLLTDVVMPGMSGRDLAERLVPLHPETKVLYMSGYAADTIVRHGVLNPGTNLLQKPFTPDALTGKVREVLTS